MTKRTAFWTCTGLLAAVMLGSAARMVLDPEWARESFERASLRTLPAGERHTLAHDAERYLQQVGNQLVSMADRRHHIGLWVQRFGHLRTLALSQHVAMLNDQLRQWRETLSASACNHRRNALTNLVKVLYGRRAAAELIDLVRFAQPPPRPRWLERSHIADVLAQLTPESKTVVRLRRCTGRECGRRRWPADSRTTSASTRRRPSSSSLAAREGGWQRYRSSAKG